MLVALAVSAPASVGAGQLGTQIPSNCVAHTSFDGSADLVDDYRCAGLAIEFHTAGVGVLAWLRSGPGNGCSSTRTASSGSGRARSTAASIRPSTRRRSIVAQQFPNDPTGAKGAYLTWGYGDTPTT